MLSAKHTVDDTAKSVATSVALQRFSWLTTAGLTEEARTCTEDLPFDGTGLFNAETDDIQENIQKKRSAARCWGVYCSYQQRPHCAQWQHPYNSYQKFHQGPQRQTSHTPYFKRQS